MGTEQERVAAQALTDLLAVARQWIPDLMFEIDPRVHRARQLVATLVRYLAADRLRSFASCLTICR